MASIPADAPGSRRESDDDHEHRLNEVIAGYLEDLEAGRQPDRPALMARHPDLAAELASFFANQEHLGQLTAPLRGRRSVGDTPAVVPFHMIAPNGEERPEDEPGGPRVADRVGYFGDYELVELIAEGGMGVVFKARQVSLDRMLALKIVRSGRFATADDLQRFFLEAAAAAHLDHPNIVPIYEIGEHEGHHYFSMKLVEGGSLADHVGRLAVAPRAAARLVATVARAVHYAHQRGILHRDLKPANILLAARPGEPPERWTPLVADFGLAKRVQDQQAAGLTKSGSIVGTPGYMAPEQVAGPREAITTSADIHALGAILYELLTGRPPFRAETVLETLRLVREEEPIRPRVLDPGIDRDLETVALKCLEKVPSRRYASAAALADDLELWLEDKPIHARPARSPERLVKWARRRPAIAALLLVGLVAVAATALAVAGLFAWNRESGRRLQAEHHLDLTVHQNERIREDDYFHRILAADQALANHDPDGAGRLLDGCPPALRGWEWRHLTRRLHSELAILQGRSGLLCATEFTPSGREGRVSSDGLPGSLWGPAVRTISPGSGTGRMQGQDGTAYGLTFDRSGTRLATAGAAGIIKVWDVVSGTMTHLIRAPGGWASGVAFSPDGARLATAGEDGIVRIWDIGPESGPDGRLLDERIGHDGPVFGVAFRADGARVASAGSDGTVRVWDPSSPGTESVAVLRGHEGEVMTVAFHPDATRIASGGADRSVRIWDLRSNSELATIPAGTAHRINAVAYSPDGARLAVGSHDRSVAIWDAATFRRLIDYPGHSGPVLYVGFSPRGDVLASAGQDATIKLWDAESEPGMQQLRVEPARQPSGSGAKPGARWPAESPRWVGGVAFSPTDGDLAAAGTESVVATWDANGHLKRLFRGGWGPMIGVAHRPDGLQLATIGAGRMVRLWDLGGSRSPLDISDWSELFSSLAYRPDGRMLATGGGIPPEVIQLPRDKWSPPEHDGRTIRLWNPADGHQIRALHGHIGSVHALAFTPQGDRLASAGADGKVRIWDPDSGRLLETLEGHSGSVFALAYSPDGRRLASAGFDRDIRIWDTVSRRLVRTLSGHANWVLGLAFAPDRERLASAGADQTVRLWDTAHGRAVLTLHGPRDRVHGVAFSPDGGRLAAASADGFVRVWEAGPP